MDAYDLFQKLTMGAKFAKNQNDYVPAHAEMPVPLNPIEERCNHESKSSGTDDTDNYSNDKNTTEFNKLSGVLDAVTNNLKRKVKKEQFSLSLAQRKEQLQQQEIRSLRRKHNIVVHGKNIPPPIVNFDELSTKYRVIEQLIKNIYACNITQPTPVQMQSIPIMLMGRSLMVCAPTGSGKTIAYLTPILNDLRKPQKVGFRALILAPTRELAHQIYRECVRLAENTALGIQLINQISTAKQIFSSASNKRCDILISTPNRVRHFLSMEPPLLNLEHVGWFVLDEADRLMEEGQNNFKEQLEDILAACTNSSKKVAFFSATCTAPVAKWALKNLKNLARVNVGQQNSACEYVKQELLFVGSERGKLLEICKLLHCGFKPPILIFVQSKDRAKQLFEELLYDNINVDIIHADRTQQQRDNCVRAFRDGHIWVLICTELMGRGIDFKGVNLVINYDFPQSSISYIHRIGRTGRAGKPGHAITFCTETDLPYLRRIAHIVKNCGGNISNYMMLMKKITKSENKKLSKCALKREDITRDLKRKKKFQQTKAGKTEKKQKANENEESQEECNNSVKKEQKTVKKEMSSVEKTFIKKGKETVNKKSCEQMQKTNVKKKTLNAGKQAGKGNKIKNLRKQQKIQNLEKVLVRKTNKSNDEPSESVIETRVTKINNLKKVKNLMNSKETFIVSHKESNTQKRKKNEN